MNFFVSDSVYSDHSWWSTYVVIIMQSSLCSVNITLLLIIIYYSKYNYTYMAAANVDGLHNMDTTGVMMTWPSADFCLASLEDNFQFPKYVRTHVHVRSSVFINLPHYYTSAHCVRFLQEWRYTYVHILLQSFLWESCWIMLSVLWISWIVDCLCLLPHTTTAFFESSHSCMCS